MLDKLEESINILQSALSEVNTNLNKTQEILNTKTTEFLIEKSSSNSVQDKHSLIEQSARKETSFFEYIDQQKITLLENENIKLRNDIKNHKNLLLQLSNEIENLIKQIKA